MIIKEWEQREQREPKFIYQMEIYPTYYRIGGKAIRRNNATNGTEVLTPAANQKLPLCMGLVTYPTRERFDEDVAGMEQVDQACFEDYVYAFIRGSHRVEQDMTELQLKRETVRLENQHKK